MGSNNCMNEVCRATTSSEWKKGWGLKSGEFATLCYNCGSAFENSVFCETFHFRESGWRECKSCGKLIHCGCIASKYLHEYMDLGGIGCVSCAKHLELLNLQSVKIPGCFPNRQFSTNGTHPHPHPLVDHKSTENRSNSERFPQLAKYSGANDVISKIELFRQNESMLNIKETLLSLPTLRQYHSLPTFIKTEDIQPKEGDKDMYQYLARPSLDFSGATNFTCSSTVIPFPADFIEGRKRGKSDFQSGRMTNHKFPKLFKHTAVAGSEIDKGSIAQSHVSRPPAEGRSRSQLLPRYWPKITVTELQQLSGDLKSSIVPLFEKILSASDAGRIGRLVLPKACAEAYFPPINQSEGIPIKIQDVKGKFWTFQFRFWPNNNSRMYVLEGVTPCIQNMQVQAGDIVTFSRIDPGGQLVIGCRKETNNGDELESLVPGSHKPGETSFCTATDILLPDGGGTPDDSMQQPMPISERKTRNIKNKRLIIHNDVAVELRITWEEAQELLRPSPSAEATIVMVDNLEFEEFDEPPIFGKRTFFTSRSSGEQEQLAQCDSCSKWRRLPVHALLSSKWTCSDNIWDSSRCSCSALEDIDTRELESFFASNNEFKKRRISVKMSKGVHSGLDTLATIAVMGNNIGDMGESSAGATTRHPRHRPGCSCIVCIQPPSGKGKHESSCKCNVCLTVKRRFKTLMMRKKMRQSEREALLAQEKDKATLVKVYLGDEEHMVRNLFMNCPQETDYIIPMALPEAKKDQLDLNTDPCCKEQLLEKGDGMSLTTSMNAATSIPSDIIVGDSSLPCGAPSLDADDKEAKEVLLSGIL